MSAANDVRMAFLHSPNRDAEGYEWGVAKVRFGSDGQPESFLWGASDHSDLDAAMPLQLRPDMLAAEEAAGGVLIGPALAATGTPQVPSDAQIEDLGVKFGCAVDIGVLSGNRTIKWYGGESFGARHMEFARALVTLASQGAAPADLLCACGAEWKQNGAGWKMVKEPHRGGMRPGLGFSLSAAPTSAGDAEPYAYAIGIAAEQREELAHSLDEVTDELTNCECVVTPLYAAPQQPADHVPEAGFGDTAARPRLEEERKAAEQEYTITAFDYPEAPIGSRDWVLWWAGWLARSTHSIGAAPTGASTTGLAENGGAA